MPSRPSPAKPAPIPCSRFAPSSPARATCAVCATWSSEVFTERRQPLPALSLIQSGGLPLEGAQVVLEAIAREKGGQPARPGLRLRSRRHQRESPRSRRAARRTIARPIEEPRSRPPVPRRPTSCASPASSVPWTISLPPVSWWKPIIPAPRSITSRPSAPRRAPWPPAKPSRGSPGIPASACTCSRRGRAPGRTGRRAARRAHRHPGQLSGTRNPIRAWPSSA